MPTTRPSKWQQRKKAICKKFDAVEKTREQTANYWDLMALPKRTYTPKQKKVKKIINRTQQQRSKDRYSVYKTVCREVDERDNHTCQHPGCNCKIIQHHHARFKSQGGQDKIEELVSLCYHHHQGDESPHKLEYWRNYWIEWLSLKYPNYWNKIRESKEIRKRVI